MNMRASTSSLRGNPLRNSTNSLPLSANAKGIRPSSARVASKPARSNGRASLPGDSREKGGALLPVS